VYPNVTDVASLTIRAAGLSVKLLHFVYSLYLCVSQGSGSKQLFSHTAFTVWFVTVEADCVVCEGRRGCLGRCSGGLSLVGWGGYEEFSVL